MTKKRTVPGNGSFFCVSSKILDLLHVDRFLTSFIFSDVIRNGIILAHLINQTAYVYKNILLTFVINDETKTFSLVEKFHFTC